MTEKIPPVLSEEPSIDELEECVAVGANYICHDFESAREAYKRGQLAQRDADVAYIQQARREGILAGQKQALEALGAITGALDKHLKG